MVGAAATELINFSSTLALLQHGNKLFFALNSLRESFRPQNEMWKFKSPKVGRPILQSSRKIGHFIASGFESGQLGWILLHHGVDVPPRGSCECL